MIMSGWGEPIGWLFSGHQISLLFKVSYTIFIGIVIVVYWRYYGVANFLWFSDLALLITFVAIWLESPFLVSMQAVSVLFLELVWIVDFMTRLISGATLLGLTEYMFQAKNPLFVRGLSLFHVVLPIFLLWLVYRLGYDRQAWIAQTILAWLVLLTCFFFTEPSKNINWVFGPGKRPQQWVAPGVYLLILMIVFPICIYFPTQLALQAIMPR
jgi:hypothetical protein